MAEQKTWEAKQVELGLCPDKKCYLNGGRLFKLGVTIGAAQLKGCVKCRRVYWSE